MTTTLRTLPLLTKVALVVGLLLGVILAQAGFAQPTAPACEVAGTSSGQHSGTARADCPRCCAAMPCCLVSKNRSDTPASPEPLSNERTHQPGDAAAAVTFTLVPVFDFLVPPHPCKVVFAPGPVRSARDGAPRGAVSCIWLI